jgi:hypothetical protein
MNETPQQAGIPRLADNDFGPTIVISAPPMDAMQFAV